MKAVVYTDTGEPSVLHLVERPVPEPGPGVTHVAPGDRVWVMMATAPAGTAQEFTVLPAWCVVALPDAASFDVGAALGVPAGTAHRALTVADGWPTRLAPDALKGATVLVSGGAGAVGHAAVQLARWAGATVITTVSGPETIPVPIHPSLVVNARLQFLLLLTVGQDYLLEAAEDIRAALRDGALPVGEEHGLPLIRFPLAETAAAHAAVEGGAVGKVMVDVS